MKNKNAEAEGCQIAGVLPLFLLITPVDWRLYCTWVSKVRVQISYMAAVVLHLSQWASLRTMDLLSRYEQWTFFIKIKSDEFVRRD